MACVRDERELADDEDASPLVQDAAVELPLLVLEDPQASDLAGQARGHGLVVAVRDAEQDAEPVVDLAHGLALHEDARPRDALHDGPHALYFDSSPGALDFSSCFASSARFWSVLPTRLGVKPNTAAEMRPSGLADTLKMSASAGT